MPFTFSHPALVLPLITRRSRFFSATGLVIGSIAPDFESFIRVSEHKLYSHTWLGIFWFDLPLAIAIAFVFHDVVRDPLLQNLPGAITGKFACAIGFNWNRFFIKNLPIVISSMLIGITSHLLWDAFTHLNISNPDVNATKILIFNTYLHSLLQDLSSVTGLIIVVWYIIRLPDQGIYENGIQPQAGGKAGIEFWFTVASLSMVSGWLIHVFVPKPIDIILKIDIVISGILQGLLITCIFFNLAGPRLKR